MSGFPPKMPLALGNRVFLFSAQNFSKCQGAALGQNGLKTRYFAISRPWGSGRSKRNCKKVARFSGATFGCLVFFLAKVPLAPGNRAFLFPARNFSKCQGATLGQKGVKTPVFCDFPPLGVRSVKTQSVKSCAIFGRNFWAAGFSPQKCP